MTNIRVSERMKFKRIDTDEDPYYVATMAEHKIMASHATIINHYIVRIVTPSYLATIINHYIVSLYRHPHLRSPTTFYPSVSTSSVLHQDREWLCCGSELLIPALH